MQNDGIKLFVVLQCIAKPIHSLVQSNTFFGGRFKYLECSVFQSVQSESLMYFRNVHTALDVLFVGQYR